MIYTLGIDPGRITSNPQIIRRPQDSGFTHRCLKTAANVAEWLSQLDKFYARMTFAWPVEPTTIATHKAHLRVSVIAVKSKPSFEIWDEALNRKSVGVSVVLNALTTAGAVQRLSPKLMTVCVVLASLIPILWESGIGSDVMKPIAAPLVGGMITSTIHVLILVPVFCALMKERALRLGTLRPQSNEAAKDFRHEMDH